MHTSTPYVYVPDTVSPTPIPTASMNRNRESALGIFSASFTASFAITDVIDWCMNRKNPWKQAITAKKINVELSVSKKKEMADIKQQKMMMIVES